MNMTQIQKLLNKVFYCDVKSTHSVVSIDQFEVYSARWMANFKEVLSSDYDYAMTMYDELLVRSQSAGCHV